MQYKILDTKWFTNATLARLTLYGDTCIGIVAVETWAETGEWKCYIGMGNGLNREADQQQIAMHGSGLFAEQAQGFFPRLDIGKYKDD